MPRISVHNKDETRLSQIVTAFLNAKIGFREEYCEGDTSSTAAAVPLLPLEKALDNIRFVCAVRLLRENHFLAFPSGGRWQPKADG